jgi:RING finger and CHY zinc finger domain-containing protein 1
MNNNLQYSIDSVLSEDILTPPYGCKHYLRRCTLIAPCCDNKVFNCRRCHDEQTDHKLDPKTSKIICTNCKQEQSPSQYCTHCKICLGFYFCEHCALYDDVDKEQYHCDKCGICRLYKNKSFHCDNCQTCLNTCLKDKHKCSNIKDTYCPICMEYLFDSTQGMYQAKCGHSLHYVCLMSLLETTNRCPICSKSIFNLQVVDQLIDLEIQQTPMPEELKNKQVDILCNDCNTKTTTNFHIVALKCSNCNSYNTKQI